MLYNKGFTLLELLTTMAIVSILFSVAIPSLYGTLQSQQRLQVYDELNRLIHYTRSRAAFSTSDVILCPTKNKIHCINNWQMPIMVFIDKNKNRRRDNEEPIDRIKTVSLNDYTITWRASATSRYLRYARDGSTEYQNGTFTLCPIPSNIKDIRKLIVYFSGRVREATKNEVKLSDC
ncbi:GspH/FimT family pseudopilin [Eionea flava]